MLCEWMKRSLLSAAVEQFQSFNAVDSYNYVSYLILRNLSLMQVRLASLHRFQTSFYRSPIVKSIKLTNLVITH